MINHFTATATGTVARLSSLLGTITGDARSGINDNAKWISIQAHGGNSGIGYVGGCLRTVTNADYGWRIEIPTATIPDAPTVIDPAGSPLSIDTLFLLGTNNDKFAITVCV